MAVRTNQVVYYLTHRECLGVVKIGTTVDLERRVARLIRQSQPGLVPLVMAVEPGGEELERSRHRQFRTSRLTGEWFWLTPDLRRHIEHLSAREGIVA